MKHPTFYMLRLYFSFLLLLSVLGTFTQNMTSAIIKILKICECLNKKLVHLNSNVSEPFQQRGDVTDVLCIFDVKTSFGLPHKITSLVILCLRKCVGHILYHTAMKVIYLEPPDQLESSDVCVFSVLELSRFLCSDL
jgi:hypothetical protein